MEELITKTRHFWNILWSKIKSGFNKNLKNPLDVTAQSYRDTEKINFLNMFIDKLNDYVNNETTFDIVTDSKVAAPLDKLIKDIELHRFEITSEMLGKGDLWVFPATNEKGELYHRYVSQEDVRIQKMDGDKIVEITAIIDKYISDDGNVFLLVRHHCLDTKNGVLTIDTCVTDESDEPTELEQWDKYVTAYEFHNVNNIGVGRFKSPKSSRGKSTVYGVPLNYDCKEIEDRIFDDIEDIKLEFKNGKSILFADSMILRKKNDIVRRNGKSYTQQGFEIPENLFPIDTRSGQSGSKIDIFSPDFRYTALRERLIDDMRMYEQQIGVDRGFITAFEKGIEATATEVRYANSNTLAIINKIQNAIYMGVLSTISADCIYLNISEDLFSVKIDWYDVFADQDIQYQRISQAAKDGWAEPVDVMKWLFPNLTIDELWEKYERIQTLNKEQNAEGSEQNTTNDDTHLKTLKITNETARLFDSREQDTAEKA